jgi:hypothetical protein
VFSTQLSGTVPPMFTLQACTIQPSALLPPFPEACTCCDCMQLATRCPVDRQCALSGWSCSLSSPSPSPIITPTPLLNVSSSSSRSISRMPGTSAEYNKSIPCSTTNRCPTESSCHVSGKCIVLQSTSVLDVLIVVFFAALALLIVLVAVFALRALRLRRLNGAVQLQDQD